MSDAKPHCPHQPRFDGIKQFDLLDPETRANPHAYYAWLQDDPTRRLYTPPFEKSFLVVHRYEDVKFILTNHKLFSNAILPTQKSPFLALMDGDDHQRIRNVVMKIFQLENPSFPKEAIHETIRRVTENLVNHGKGELFDAWATPIPLASLCHVFGLPNDFISIRQLHNQAIAINKALFVLGGTGPRRKPHPSFAEKLQISWALLNSLPKLARLKSQIGMQGLSELKKMLFPVKTTLEIPRPNFSEMPKGLKALLDLMILFGDALFQKENKSFGILLLREALSQKKISEAEAIMLCTFILFAGYETTASLLSNTVAHLAQAPEDFSKLKNDPALIPSFMEESLRYYTPVGRFLRRANEKVVLGDQVIPKGSIVMAMVGAANTDPERFENPYNHFPERKMNNHLSFGKGIHFCAGAPLARFQTLTALQELLNRTKSLNLDETKERRFVTDRDNGIFRYEELWIRIG